MVLSSKYTGILFHIISQALNQPMVYSTFILLSCLNNPYTCTIVLHCISLPVGMMWGIFSYLPWNTYHKTLKYNIKKVFVTGIPEMVNIVVYSFSLG